MLKSRLITAAVLLAGLFAALFYLSPDAWIVSVAAVSAIAAWEWSGFSRLGTSTRFAYAILVSFSVFWCVSNLNSSLNPFWVYAAAAAFWAVVVPWWLSRPPRAPGIGIMLGVGVAALFPMFVAAVDLRAKSPVLLLAILAIVWISDTVAYFSGKQFGRNKLAPSISPGKTWEGVWGALIAVAVYAAVWANWPAGLKLNVQGLSAAISDVIMILFIVTLAVAGIIGDLFESQMKRHAGLKDSGIILPGHGGVLDRIDALQPVLPIAALAFLR